MLFSRALNWRVLTVFLAAAAVLPARAVEPDKLTPADSENVFVINVRQILDSPLIKKYGLEQLRTAIKGSADAKKLIESTGLDPLKDIHTISISASGLSGHEPKVLIVVHGNFDLDKVHAAAAEYAKSKPEELKVEKKDGLKVYEVKSKEMKDKPVFAAFADKNTLIVCRTADQTVAAAKSTGDSKVGKELGTALDKIGGKESVYLASLVTDDMRKSIAGNPKMKELAPRLQFLTGTFDLTDDFRMNLKVQTADARAADQVKMFVDQFVPMIGLMAASNEKAGPLVGELVKKITVKKDNNAVSVNLTISEDMLKEFNKIANNSDKNNSDKNSPGK